MVTAIRIYIEGGGDKKEQKARLRTGFRKFLESIFNSARHQNIGSPLLCVESYVRN